MRLKPEYLLKDIQLRSEVLSDPSSHTQSGRTGDVRHVDVLTRSVPESGRVRVDEVLSEPKAGVGTVYVLTPDRYCRPEGEARDLEGVGTGNDEERRNNLRRKGVRDYKLYL